VSDDPIVGRIEFGPLTPVGGGDGNTSIVDAGWYEHEIQRLKAELAEARLNDERYRRLREALTDIFYAPWDPADIAKSAPECKP